MSTCIDSAAPIEPDAIDDAVAVVETLVLDGRYGDAAEVAQSALRHDRVLAEEGARLRLALSTLLFVSGQPGAVDEADIVLAQPDLPDELHVRAELARLLGLLAADELDAARGQAQIMLAESNPAAIAGALLAFGLLAWDDGRVNDSISFVKAAVQRADGGAEEARRIHPRVALTAMLIAVGELREAADCLTAARDEIDEVGDVLWNDAPRVFLACLHVAEGHLDQAVAEVEQALAESESLGTTLLVPLAHFTCAHVALLRGDLDEAARQLRAVPPGAGPRIGYGRALRVWVEARLEAGRHGLRTVVVDDAADLYAAPVAHWRLFVEEPASAAWFVRAALAAGRTKEAATVASCAELVAAMNPGVGTVAASADHARGVLDRDADVLDRAAAGHTRAWAKASAMEEAAVVLLDRGDEAGARERLAAAVTHYEAAGATHDAARVRGRLRHVATRPTGRDGRPVRGWASLTDTEGHVADLVASGLTNPEVGERVYLSRHTIDFHLRQIYRKLEIHSRVELARLVTRRDLRP